MLTRPIRSWLYPIRTPQCISLCVNCRLVTSTLLPAKHSQLAHVTHFCDTRDSCRCRSAHLHFTQIKTSMCTFYRDVLDGEAEDDGPDHSQGHLDVSVHNFCAITKTNRGRISGRPHSYINPVVVVFFFTIVHLFLYSSTSTRPHTTAPRAHKPSAVRMKC